MSKSIKYKSIKYGDPRIFFESKTSQPFNGPNGIHYDTGAIVRGTTHVVIGDKAFSVSLPSMAELIYYQAHKNLEKAATIKNRALKSAVINGYYCFEDEDLFFTYMQMFSLGLLGLYSSIEGMVFELYIRKNKEKKVTVDGKELTLTSFSNLGFKRKITSVASQLSGKPNIHNTDLLDKALYVKELRDTIQHWNIESGKDFFINLPVTHPLRVFPILDPLKLSQNTRDILDHYSLKQQ